MRFDKLSEDELLKFAALCIWIATDSEGTESEAKAMSMANDFLGEVGIRNELKKMQFINNCGVLVSFQRKGY